MRFRSALIGLGMVTATLIVATAQTYKDSGGTILQGFVPVTPGVGPLFTAGNPGVISSSGSGGGPATLASGAVASGAYAAGSLASGAGVDGWDATQGAKADAAYTGSGSPSVISLLKALYTALTSALPAGTNTIGSVTVGPNGASLAPTGKTDTSAITVIGASGNASNHEYMTGLQIGRSDAGTAAITAAVTDGTLTLTFVVPNNGGGGGNNITFPTPFQWALNHAVTCTASGSVTTFYCYAQSFNAP
jgi:hypothetical protein